LQGAPVLVTGAASGIGRATVLHLASLGAALALVDSDDDALAAVAAEVSRAGDGAIPALAIVGEVADRAQVDQAVEQTPKTRAHTRVAQRSGRRRPAAPIPSQSEQET
jgi:NAD(P)-dependent dehydrogenase (short-subunit alcohol dehydrogenase family)